MINGRLERFIQLDEEKSFDKGFTWTTKRRSRERERGSVLIKNNKQRRRDIVNEDENRIPDSILSAIDGQTVVTNMPEDEQTAKT